MANNYPRKNGNGTNNFKRNAYGFPMGQWVLSCCIIIAMLLIVYVVALMDNPADKTDVGSVAPQTQSSETVTHPSQWVYSSEPTQESTTESYATTTQSTAASTQATSAPTVVSSEMGIITAEYSNARTGPGASYDLVKKVYEGEKYKILGTAEANNGITWYKLEIDGREAYVCGAFVRRDIHVVGGRAYLTFDDGPSKNTPKILDILDKYNVKATFFVIYSKDYTDEYKEILDRGHTLALHSYTHDYKTIYSSQTAYFNDLDKLSDYINGLTGFTPNIMRFPGGSSNTVSRKYCQGIMSTLTKEVQNRGYYYFDWNVDSGDADGTTIPADTLIKNIKERLGSRSDAMILMHDASKKTTTVEALPQIIEYIQSCGYEILPITADTPAVHHSVNN